MHKLFVVFSSHSERNTMWRFLNQFDFKKLSKTEIKNQAHLVMGEELDLPLRMAKKSIGLKADQFIPQWGWGMMAWLSRCSKFKANSMWSVVYHDNDELPVINRSTLEKEVITVNDEGIMQFWKNSPRRIGPVSHLQKKFIENINNEWKEYPLK